MGKAGYLINMVKKLKMLFLFLVLVMAVIPLGTGVSLAATAYDVDWVRQFGSVSQDDIWAAGTDGLGYAYSAGDALASINGADHPGASGNRDAFVIKYNDAGGVEWTRGFGTASSDIAYGVTGDSLGNSYVVGETDGNLVPGGHIGGRDGFIRQYDSAGTAQWTYQFGMNNNDECNAVAADAAGNSYVVGMTYGTMDSVNINSYNGSGDAYIRKYDVDGAEQWTRFIGTAHSEYAYGVAVDSYGNAYVTGKTSGQFAGQVKTGVSDAFVRKYASNGEAKWTCQWGISSENVYPTSIAADAYGNTYVAGYNSGYFPGQSASGTGSDYDAFVSRITNSGTLDWNRQFGTSDIDHANGVATDASGNAFVTGYVTGALPGQTYGGNQDAFVRQYSSDGTEQWTYQYTTTRSSPAVDGGDNANGIASDSSGNVYVAGTIFGHFPGYTDQNYDGYMLKMVPPSAPSGQVWYLDSIVGTGAYRVMEKTVGTQSGSVPVVGTTELWLSNLPAGAGGVVFEDGAWKVHLENTFTGDYSVQVGQSNGTHGDFTAFHYPESGTAAGPIDLNIDLTGISVLQGNYLALLVNNTGTGDVITDGSSYVSSPDSAPSYPIPEIAAGVLMALGLAGLSGLIFMSRKRARAAVQR
jgi:hypothetical protein